LTKKVPGKLVFWKSITLIIDQFTMSEGFYHCAIGITAPAPLENLDDFVEVATQTGHDFVVVPIANDHYKRVLFEGIDSKHVMNEWRAGLPLTPDDLVLKKVGSYKCYTDTKNIHIFANLTLLALQIGQVFPVVFFLTGSILNPKTTVSESIQKL
jgi:hypothetical protein